MYGLVNQAIVDLVVTEHGEEMWDRIRAAASVAETRFIAEELYDDAITFDLVAATSEVLGLAAHDVLVAFGRHWILFTGREGWGPVLDLAGSTVLEVLETLDVLHHRVESSMPGARLPNFQVTSSAPQRIELEYTSQRRGLAPMVVGLLTGLGERLNDPHSITLASSDEDDDGSVHHFVLEPAVQPAVP